VPERVDVLEVDGVDVADVVVAQGVSFTRSYDSLGRRTSYQDADGHVSTISAYDVRDRVITSSDGKGTQTRGYDPARGLLTSLDDSQAGHFTATYDPDATITSRGLPNGLTAASTIDEAGNETRLLYTKASNCGTSCTWLDNQAPVNAHHQRASQTTTTQTGPLSQGTYSYDAAGRLSRTDDTPESGGCTSREYVYDANSNRTTLTVKAPASGGACQPAATGTATTSTYGRLGAP
jgi:YD repeat-containing protein